jgi:hypothetical protein
MLALHGAKPITAARPSKTHWGNRTLFRVHPVPKRLFNELGVSKFRHKADEVGKQITYYDTKRGGAGPALECEGY